MDPDGVLPTGGQYYVDQATGQYYYQSNDGETMTVVQQQAAQEEENGETSAEQHDLLVHIWLKINGLENSFRGF